MGRGFERDSIAIAVFGEMLVDEFPDRTVLGGAPFNVAFHLKCFGLEPKLITRVGTDPDGIRLQRALETADLDTRGVQQDAAHETGRVRVAFGDAGHTFEILPDRAYDFIDPDATGALARSLDLGLTYFGTLAQRGKQSRRALDVLLESSQCPRWLDVNLRDPWFDAETVDRSLAVADHAKMNEGELAAVSRLLGLRGHDALAWAASMIEAYRLRTVVVTCGEQGAWSLAADGAEARVEGSPLGGPLADTVGAGDGFAAVSILGLVRGWPPERALARADSFARALCLIHGAIPADPGFHRPFLDRWDAEDT